MTETSLFEDVGGVTTELRDGKNVLNRRDLQPYVDKLRDIEKLTLEALANGQGYEFRTRVLTENADKAFNNFKEAAHQLEEQYTVSIQRDNLPAQEGEQPRTLFRIALTEKREDSPVTAAKKAFGVAKRNLVNRSKDLQVTPNDPIVVQAAREALTIAVKAGQEADRLVKADAENQTSEQMDTHNANMRALGTIVEKVQPMVAEKAAPAKK